MALFIGGQADGRRMDLEGTPPYARLPYRRPLPSSSLEALNGREETLKMEIENYHHIYRDIYVHESLAHKDLFDLLVAGYRQEQ